MKEAAPKLSRVQKQMQTQVAEGSSQEVTRRNKSNKSNKGNKSSKSNTSNTSNKHTRQRSTGKSIQQEEQHAASVGGMPVQKDLAERKKLVGIQKEDGAMLRSI